jgi:hypothetical protein
MHIAIHINVVYDVLPMTCNAVRALHVIESICNPLTCHVEGGGEVRIPKAAKGG